QYNKPEFSARAIAKLHVLNAQLHLKLDHKNACALELKNALNVLLPNHDANVLPNFEDLYAENTFIDIFDLLGNIQVSSTNALNCYDRSFYVTNLLTENITSQEAKLRHAGKNRKRSEACIAILYQDFKSLKKPNIIVKALAYAEKNKAAILKETIAKKTLLQLHPKDTLLIKEQVLLTTQADLTNKLIKAEFEKNAKIVNDLSYKLSKISNDLKYLKNKIDLSYPIDKNENFIDDLKRKLKKEKASLVEYFYGENDVYTFIVSDKSLQFFKFKRDEDFDASISNCINYFNSPNTINNDVSKFTTDAFNLYHQLKLNRVKASNNIIVIPDGFLNFMPFESLLTKESKTTNYSKMPFLIQKQCIAYNTSAELFVKGKLPEFNDDVLGVFPVFKNTKKALTFSEDEAKSIDQFTDAKFLMYTSATKKDAFKQANNYGVLHFSTHADAGSFSIPANIEFADENLFLNELYTKQLDNNLVVLSACETGIGKLNKGEGSMSLARGFQYAGINQLVFSLWKVNDKSTSQIMHNFYKNYSKFESIAIANQKSKQQYLNDKSISNAKKSPYYWSAFVYYGTSTAKAKPTILNYLLFTFIGLAIALLLWTVIRKLKHGR
ncbi:MAG: CHAT domain-containing protein, partial [Flavobacteriaceae bacterium]|nr:CHAT domain-containing protein [Flavobacteriaceae bacterium]